VDARVVLRVFSVQNVDWVTRARKRVRGMRFARLIVTIESMDDT